MNLEKRSSAATARSQWQYQLAAIARIDWLQVRANWQDTPRKNIVMFIISFGLLGLPASFLLRGAIGAFPEQSIIHNLPTLCITVFLLLLSMQSLQAPTKLWNMPDLQWYFIAPLPLFLLLARPILSLLKSSLSPIIIVLFLVSILMIIWHGSFALLLLFSIISIYGCISCALIALLGILILTWLFGVKRAQIAVMGAAGIMSIPALLVFFSLLAPKIITLQSIPLLIYLQEPIITLIALLWKLLTQVTILTPLDMVVLLTILLVVPATLLSGYFWLGKHLYQRTWEGLQQSNEEEYSSSQTITPHPIWEMAWHLPGISPAQAVLVGYCWQDAIRNWTDLPTIVVYFLIGVMSQVVPLLNGGNIQEYRDLLPLLGIMILLGENQFILLTIGKSLISRMLKADWLLQETPVTAHDIFSATTIAIFLPIAFIWSGIGLIVCIILGIQPISIVITIAMFILGLAVSTPVTLSMSIFSARRGYQLSIMLFTWILSMVTVICVTTIATLLLFPTLSASMQSSLGQLGKNVFHLTFLPFEQVILFLIDSGIIIIIIIFSRRIGIYRLRQEMRSI